MLFFLFRSCYLTAYCNVFRKLKYEFVSKEYKSRRDFKKSLRFSPFQSIDIDRWPMLSLLLFCIANQVKYFYIQRTFLFANIPLLTPRVGHIPLGKPSLPRTPQGFLAQPILDQWTGRRFGRPPGWLQHLFHSKIQTL